MKRGISQWKRLARRELSGKAGMAVLACILVSALNLILGSFSSALFPGNTILSRILGEVFSFAVTLVFCVLTAGLYYLFLNMARHKEYSLKDLVYFFSNQPDRIIAASAVLAVIAWITGLPATVYGYTSGVPQTLEEELRQMAILMFLILLGQLVNILITVPFTLSYYLLADREELGGLMALKESVRLMRGHIGKYILLQASFLPWLLLVIFTMYLALLWLLPYMQMTDVIFYRDIIGELDAGEGEIAWT